MSKKTSFKLLNPIFLCCLSCIFYCNDLHAQTLPIKFELEVQGIGTTNSVVPFWMRSNQFGSVPLSKLSSSFISKITKEYSFHKKDSSDTDQKLIDWGFGFEGRANLGQESNLQLLEAYAKARAGIFQLKIGRSRDVMGLNGDSTLSSGNFAISGNALGIPKIELAIPEYYSLPIIGRLFAVKGNFVHGIIGRARILEKTVSLPPANEVFYTLNTMPNTYFHQKSLYIRMGREEWKLKLYGGFNHQVFWGNENAAYGPNFKLSPLNTFYYVVTGKAYGSRGVPRSKIGNQLGSIDVGVEYDFNKYKVLIYRQNFYDVGALSKLANIADGLTGITIQNKKYRNDYKGFKWKKALLEFFYSKNQAGYPWSKPPKPGDEDSSPNYYYLNGWSYYGLGLGNPLITTRHDSKPNHAFSPNDYFINNRIIALHGGISGSIEKFNFSSKISYSWNYGTFGTSVYGNSTGEIRNPQTSNLFTPVQQLSLYLAVNKEIQNGYNAGIATALDNGKLLNNSLGLILNLKKSF